MFAKSLICFLISITLVQCHVNQVSTESTTIEWKSTHKLTTVPPTTTSPSTTTIQPKSPLNGSCSTVSDCGHHTYCHQIGTTIQPKGVCACLLGYLPSPDEINCFQLNCTKSSDCRSVFGNDTKCYSNQCVCDSSFKLNSANQTCLPDRFPLNGSCSFDSDCGTNTVCGSHRKCRCRLGTLPVPTNHINCHYYHCTINSDCSKFSANTLCVNGYCYCNQANSTLDHDTQKCIIHGQVIGCNCTGDSQCGTNANCVQDTCHCQFGFVPLANHRDCQVLSCTGDSQCRTQIDVNSHCYRSVCYCNSGFELNPALQTCVFSSAKSHLISLSCIGLMMILIIGNKMLI